MHHRNSNLPGRIKIWAMLQKIDDGNFIVNLVKQVTLNSASYAAQTEETSNADKSFV